MTRSHSTTGHHDSPRAKVVSPVHGRIENRCECAGISIFFWCVAVCPRPHRCDVHTRGTLKAVTDMSRSPTLAAELMAAGKTLWRMTAGGPARAGADAG